jgi:hypothetical protein
MISFGAAFERSIFRCVRKANDRAKNAGRFAAMRETVSACSTKKRGKNRLKEKTETPDYTPRDAG